MTRPHKAKTTAANEGQRNRIAPMNTNDSDENGDRRPSTGLYWIRTESTALI
ncbi:hypothetical protein BCR33DRAFT_726368 [Rhizoclosmatium globosum]|uniref:Uncharacterized protein n=1 Tax=Rhizoclosmatium globosum TaxID=329046 RepID=A0A1Y2AUR2_9FUNG|nr:hypothetical protein BCR33DRAFT_726368 [Rhizoclosmatium globosum]|eukprot:ORY26299.1 hypothetical protein BCR33DRAFT_726368 [Rhizoclosmatium globosum]